MGDSIAKTDTATNPDHPLPSPRERAVLPSKALSSLLTTSIPPEHRADANTAACGAYIYYTKYAHPRPLCIDPHHVIEAFSFTMHDDPDTDELVISPSPICKVMENGPQDIADHLTLQRAFTAWRGLPTDVRSTFLAPP